MSYININAHTEPLFKSLNLLKAEGIFKIKVLNFYYKYHKRHYHFIFMKYSPKLLINTFMRLDNNQFKFFIAESVKTASMWKESTEALCRK